MLLSRRSVISGLIGGLGMAVLPLPAYATLPRADGAGRRRHRHKVIVVNAPTDGTDATAAITRQIRHAPRGSTIFFPVGRDQGRYRVDGTLALHHRHRLTITGPAAGNPAVFWTDKTGQQAGHANSHGISTRQHWNLSNCSDIAMRYLHVEGPNTVRGSDGYPYLHAAQEPEHAIAVLSSDRILIEHCSAHNVYGDGIYLGPENGAPTRNVTVHKYRTVSQGRHGMGIVNASRVQVVGLVVTNGGTGGIDLEPNGRDAVHNVGIFSSSFDVRRVAFSALGAHNVSNVAIVNNTVTHALSSWPMVIAASGSTASDQNWIVQGNQQRFRSTSSAGISFGRVTNVFVQGNDLALAGRSSDLAGVSFDECGGELVVRHNKFGSATKRYRATGSSLVTTSGNPPPPPLPPHLPVGLTQASKSHHQKSRAAKRPTVSHGLPADWGGAPSTRARSAPRTSAPETLSSTDQARRHLAANGRHRLVPSPRTSPPPRPHGSSTHVMPGSRRHGQALPDVDQSNHVRALAVAVALLASVGGAVGNGAAILAGRRRRIGSG